MVMTLSSEADAKSKKFPTFYAIQNFTIVFSRATCPYPVPPKSSPRPPILFKILVNIILSSTLGLAQCFLFLTFPTKILYALVSFLYVLHAPPTLLVLV